MNKEQRAQKARIIKQQYERLDKDILEMYKNMMRTLPKEYRALDAYAISMRILKVVSEHIIEGWEQEPKDYKSTACSL
jgi:hypothetical protein